MDFYITSCEPPKRARLNTIDRGRAHEHHDHALPEGSLRVLQQRLQRLRSFGSRKQGRHLPKTVPYGPTERARTATPKLRRWGSDETVVERTSVSDVTLTSATCLGAAGMRCDHASQIPSRPRAVSALGLNSRQTTRYKTLPPRKLAPMPVLPRQRLDFYIAYGERTLSQPGCSHS